MIRVVAALLCQEDRFLICQRPAHKDRALLWEFVGGKVEANETDENALIRECKEELGAEIAVNSIYMEVVHEYPDMTVQLLLYKATLVSKEIQKLEHNDIQWITIDEIPNYEFCPADVEILERLQENGL